MLHIKAASGDFFIEESKILSVTQIQPSELSLIDGMLEQLYFINIYTLEGEFFVEDRYEHITNVRNVVVKETKDIWK